MKLRSLFGIAFAMVVVLASLAGATTASAALPELLPEPTAAKPVEMKGINKGETSFTSGGKTVKCVNAEGPPATNKATSLKLGEFEIKFKECSETTAGTKCTGLSDTTAGVITVKGTFHIWKGELLNAKKETVLHPAVLVFLLEHVHFSCAAGTVLFLVLGCAAGLLKETNKKVKVLTAEFVAGVAGSGNEKINDIWLVENEAKELIVCKLSSQLNEAAAEAAVQTGVAELKEFKQGGAAIEVEVMA